MYTYSAVVVLPDYTNYTKSSKTPYSTSNLQCSELPAAKLLKHQIASN